jgi:hypothetical protein
MTISKKRAPKPLPDLKSVTRQALNTVADHTERLLSLEVLFGIPPDRRTTKEEWAVFEEAKKLVVNYIRMGGKA